MAEVVLPVQQPVVALAVVVVALLRRQLLVQQDAHMLLSAWCGLYSTPVLLRLLSVPNQVAEVVLPVLLARQAALAVQQPPDMAHSPVPDRRAAQAMIRRQQLA